MQLRFSVSCFVIIDEDQHLAVAKSESWRRSKNGWELVDVALSLDLGLAGNTKNF
jgi:hypothetical protein